MNKLVMALMYGIFDGSDPATRMLGQNELFVNGGVMSYEESAAYERGRRIGEALNDGM